MSQAGARVEAPAAFVKPLAQPAAWRQDAPFQGPRDSAGPNRRPAGTGQGRGRDPLMTVVRMRPLAVLTSAVLLAACGSDSTTSPTPTPTPAPTTIPSPSPTSKVVL